MKEDRTSSSSVREPVHDHESAARILQCAIDVIESRGEAAVRVAQIAQMADIAVPSVYHWFGSREGLVIAAHGERFTRNLGALVGPYQVALDSSTTAAEFRDAILNGLELVFDPSRRVLRLTRLNVLGSAIGRPDLLKIVTERYADVVHQVVHVVSSAQQRGWVRNDYDSLTMSHYILCEIFAQVIIEFGDSNVPPARWAALSRQTMSHALFGTGVQHRGPYPIEEAAVEARPDPAPTARRILDWAVERIDERGEASLRITELGKLGVSLTSIYHHFGSRDQMVQEAQVERFTASQDAHVAFMEAAVSNCRSAADFADLVRVGTADLLSEARAANRRRRLSALGSLHGRPGLAAEIARRENELATRSALLIEHARKEGWIAAEVDSLALGAWLMGVGFSRSLIELTEAPIGDEWNDIATATIEAAFGY